MIEAFFRRFSPEPDKNSKTDKLEVVRINDNITQTREYVADGRYCIINNTWAFDNGHRYELGFRDSGSHDVLALFGVSYSEGLMPVQIHVTAVDKNSRRIISIFYDADGRQIYRSFSLAFDGIPHSIF